MNVKSNMPFTFSRTGKLIVIISDVLLHSKSNIRKVMVKR